VVLGDLESIQQHIKSGTDLDQSEPAGGSSPLITAIVLGKTDIAKALINAGADLNHQNYQGSTPLISAAFFCRRDVVEILLDKGADKTLKNNYGHTALESISAPFENVKGIYDQVGKDLGPLGLKLDYGYIEKTRPRIAEMLDSK
jgi:ankyrin repeat protein